MGKPEPLPRFMEQRIAAAERDLTEYVREWLGNPSLSVSIALTPIEFPTPNPDATTLPS